MSPFVERARAARLPIKELTPATLDALYRGQRCESGWTGDRCTFRLFHEGPHSNEGDFESTRDQRGQ